MNNVNDTFGTVVKVKIEGKEYQLRKFSIGVICALEAKYGSLEKALEKITGSPSVTDVSHVAYLLLDNDAKKKYKSVDAFRDSIDFNEFQDIISSILQVINAGLPKVNTDDSGKKK